MSKLIKLNKIKIISIYPPKIYLRFTENLCITFK